MNILLVEDEESISVPLTALLNAQGWHIFSAQTVKQAFEHIHQHFFDAAIIDLCLPDGSGYEICRALSPICETAVLVLTARNDEESVVAALEQGADDYISKPFRAKELISRIRAILRRKPNHQRYHCGCLSVDMDAAKVTVWQCPVVLTALEYRLLLQFVLHSGQILQRQQLLQLLWDESGNFVEDNTLTVTVKRLREKLGDAGNYIQTIRGMGYRWEESD